MRNKQVNIYLKALKELFNTPNGITVLKYWKETHFDVTAVVPGDSYSTMYALGKKEFIQECIKQVNTPEVLDEEIPIESEMEML